MSLELFVGHRLSPLRLWGRITSINNPGSRAESGQSPLQIGGTAGRDVVCVVCGRTVSSLLQPSCFCSIHCLLWLLETGSHPMKPLTVFQHGSKLSVIRRGPFENRPSDPLDIRVYKMTSFSIPFYRWANLPKIIENTAEPRI